MRLLFFTLLLFSSLCSAGLENYFKQISGKSPENKMRNIDFIYMINLDQRPEKFQRSAELLAQYNIYPYRFSAVNGWELSLETITNVGVKFKPGMSGNFWGTSYLDQSLEPHHELITNHDQTYFCHCMSRGAIGIVLSHLSILQDALDSGYETIWVMEDDIEPIQDPNIISNLIDKLDCLIGKEKWDVLFTDQDTQNTEGKYVPCFGYAQRPNFKPKNPSRFGYKKRLLGRIHKNQEFFSLEARYGAYSMILRRSGIEKILNFIKTHNIFLPYDMDFYLPEGIRLIGITNDIVRHQKQALSDNGGANYLNKE
jgi:GR25 family glycosyltransferase involved in LPS biosynthesis